MPYPGQSLWAVKIQFEDGLYQSDVWSAVASRALQLAMTDARSIETTPLFTGRVLEVSIIWKEAA